MFLPLLLLLNFISSPLIKDHAIYISVIEINERTISIKVFSDDLHDAVKNYTNESINLSEEEFLLQYQDQIKKYFVNHFKLLINGKEQELTLEKTRKEGDASFIYFSLEEQSKWSNVTIEAPYFMELFPDQNNVLTLDYNDEKHYSRLSKVDDSFSVTFR